MLLKAPMRTYTFVNPRAISAGAIIALATDEIYMTPVGLIGDAMPIMMSPLPMGGAQAVPEDLKEKVMSPTIALVRSAAMMLEHIGQQAIAQRLEQAVFRTLAAGKGLTRDLGGAGNTASITGGLIANL